MAKLTNTQRYALGDIINATKGRGRRGFKLARALEFFRAATIQALERQGLVTIRETVFGKSEPIPVLVPTPDGIDAFSV